MIPTINKPTRFTRRTATAIDHILIKCFTEAVFKTAIFKNGKSDHFPVCFLVPSFSTQRENKATFNYKRILNTESTESFKRKMYETDEEETESFFNPDEAYSTFLEKFIDLYDNYFPKEN